MNHARPAAMPAARSLVLAGLALLAGCAAPPQDVVVLRLDDDAHIGRAIVSKTGSTTDLTRLNLAATSVPVREDGEPADGRQMRNAVAMLKDDEVIATFAGAMAGQPRRPTIWTVYFNSDSSAVIPQSRATLAAAIETGQLTQFADISIVGHADATGAPDVNRDLSLKRATVVRNAFVAAGIPPAAIETLAVGADLPLVPAPPGVPAIDNRAVEITVR